MTKYTGSTKLDNNVHAKNWISTNFDTIENFRYFEGEESRN